MIFSTLRSWKAAKTLLRMKYVFALQHTIQEATDAFSGDAKRMNVEYKVTIWEGVPHQVIGDHRRVRQVLSNLVASHPAHVDGLS
jgi:signal transduction histidine kinase